MRMRPFIVLPMMFLISFTTAYSQRQYNFSKVDIEKGLSHNQVYAIYRDSTGFVWFGTGSGLNRFDGYNCKVFVNIPNDSSSLDDNYVQDIFGLPGNKLWIGSKTAASIYDPRTEKFDRNFAAFFKSLGLPQSRITFSLKDKRGNYWFLFEKNQNLYKYSSQSGKVIAFISSRPQTSKKTITGINEDLHGNLWLIYNNGFLEQIDTASFRSIQTSAVLVNSFNLSASSDFRVFCDRQDKLWIYVSGEPRGIFKLDPGNATVRHFQVNDPSSRLNDNMVIDIIQDTRGAIWVGTDHGGIDVIDEMDNSKITYLLNKEDDNSSLSYNTIQRLYQDNRGIVWAGTGKKGVNYINQNIIQFDLYRYCADKKDGLPYNDVGSFVEDKKGNVWMGTNGGGLIYFDRKANKFTQYLNNSANSNSLSNNVIVSLCLDHEGKLWIGTYHGGLDVFDGKNFTHYKHNPSDPTSIADNCIWHILEDRDHTMWIGTLRGGLNRFDRQTKKFTRYYFESNMPKPIHSNYIPVIREDGEGNLWIGTEVGLEILDKKKMHFQFFTHTSEPNSLSHQDIHDILEDKRGLMWIATRDGLNVCDKTTKKFRNFTNNDGLPDNGIITITEDKGGNLWVTTAKGLCQLVVDQNKKDISFQIRNFTETNNLQGKVFNENASMISSDGLIFLGGPAGFNIIDPQKVVASKNKPQLVFTNIDIFNNEVNVGEFINNSVVLRKALPFADEIKLNHNENIFSIEFTALDFSGNNQYAYKLEGFNKNWMFTNSNNRKVTYTNLDPGTYLFKVKATNSDGVWSDEERTLTIIITPPFWKTPVAFVLYILFIGVVLYLARRYTLEKAHMRFEVLQQKKESERIQALDAVKTKFFTNVSHEFRTPISLILNPLEKISRKTNDPEVKKHVVLVQRNARRLLSLVNQLLDFRKMEVQEFKLQATEGDIIKFVKEITCSFSDLSEMKNIGLSFSSNVDSLITYFDKDKLEKILFNLLSNAFKYTHSKGAIEVAVNYSGKENEQNEEIKISVKDSGIGIPNDKQDKIFERFFQNDVPANISNAGTGIGLAITKEFVKLHNGNISVDSEPDKGSIFTVMLPVHKLNGYTVHPHNTYDIITPLKIENEARGNKPGDKWPVILLVEDNDDFRFYLKDNLSQDYNVVEANNGLEAWEKLRHLKPDLIVSDVMMPYMDGIELTKRVKKNSSTVHIPVVLLTAVGDEEMQLESFKTGAADFMTKPFTYEILASRLKNILALPSTEKQPSKFVEVAPSEIEIQPADEKFLKQVLEVIEKNISNPAFTVEELSKELFMHRAGMYRKLLSLTGLTPLEFIRNIRLKRSKQLLEKKPIAHFGNSIRSGV